MEGAESSRNGSPHLVALGELLLRALADVGHRFDEGVVCPVEGMREFNGARRASSLRP